MKLIDLYRGITQKNLPKRYLGKYYTQDVNLAKWYAKNGGSIEELQFSPAHTFSIDDFLKDDKFKESVYQQFSQYMAEKHPNIDMSETQLYDNYNDNISDFSYPTKYDIDFLKSKGYDSVHFSYEGGQQVDSWFIFD